MATRRHCHRFFAIGRFAHDRSEKALFDISTRSVDTRF